MRKSFLCCYRSKPPSNNIVIELILMVPLNQKCLFGVWDLLMKCAFSFVLLFKPSLHRNWKQVLIADERNCSFVLWLKHATVTVTVCMSRYIFWMLRSYSVEHIRIELSFNLWRCIWETWGCGTPVFSWVALEASD